MVRTKRPLGHADQEEAFRIATKALPKWYGERIPHGMRDEELIAALEQVLGIFGGSCGPGRLDVMHQASGLKIWAGWHIVNHGLATSLSRSPDRGNGAPYLRDF